MKCKIFSLSGSRNREIDLPAIFSSKIREDVVVKYFEADKFIQPFSPYAEAGRRHSAAGTISHKRHDWKGHYGQGKSRVPRKTMSRRGVNFYWVGAEISGARGGRRAHPPKGIGKEKKINKKEIKMAFSSGFAATTNKDLVSSRYQSIDKISFDLPVVIESKLERVKTKDMLKLFRSIFGNSFNLILKKKEVRPGKGKARNRRYKSNAGLLLVKGSEENIKMSGIEVRSVKNVSISDLYPLGRLAVYTEKALEELNAESKK